MKHLDMLYMMGDICPVGTSGEKEPMNYWEQMKARI